MTYNFRCLNGDLISVEAVNEEQARHLAMLDRWGPATGIYAPSYKGRGLSLIDNQQSRK